MGTKLHQAIAKGDLLEVRNRLSKHRAKSEIAATDGQDQVPLVAAIYQNNVQMVEEILAYYRNQKPKDITINHQVRCFTLIYYQLEKDKRGYSALHHAVQVCDEQIVLQLLNFEGGSFPDIF